MAEIQIERKERNVWPWVLAGLVLLALLWFLFTRGDDAAERQAGADTAAVDTAVAATTGAVNSFVSYVEERRARTDADLSHEYTADGLRRLAAALGDVATRDTAAGQAIQPRLDSLRQRADDLERNAGSTNHARYAREAFVAAAGVMSAIQQQRYPNLSSQVSAVRQAAESVQPGTLLLEQKTQVQQFFDRAADAMRGMTNAGA
jgi:hypothetical protein